MDLSTENLESLMQDFLQKNPDSITVSTLSNFIDFFPEWVRRKNLDKAIVDKLLSLEHEYSHMWFLNELLKSLTTVYTENPEMVITLMANNEVLNIPTKNYAQGSYCLVMFANTRWLDAAIYAVNKDMFEDRHNNS